MTKERISKLRYVAPLALVVLLAIAWFAASTRDQESRLSQHAPDEPATSESRARDLRADVKSSRIPQQDLSGKDPAQAIEAVESPGQVTVQQAQARLYEPDHLVQYWEDEYGCTGNTGSVMGACEAHETAHSYEEALWMLSHGYPPNSIRSATQNLDLGELEAMAINKKSAAFTSLLAQRFSASGEFELADKAHSLASSYALDRDPLNTSVHVARAFDLLSRNGALESRKANARQAMQYLHTANRLGDSMAGEQLRTIAESPEFNWTVSDLNEITKSSNRFFATAFDQWDIEAGVTRRPDRP